MRWSAARSTPRPSRQSCSTRPTRCSISGFREDLDAILAKLPAERRSHLVSATFSRDVVSLADRFQRDPVHVQGTRLGEAHADIEHVVHLVEPAQRVDALINLLLADEDAKSLVFVRTRADVARVAGELAEAGFVVRTLSGEMEQAERDRALAAFRQGGVQALIATDVAARGIDVRDIARVIQVEPPTDVETYTHRSGRTGRAGKQGTSVLFVAPAHYPAIARGPLAGKDRPPRGAGSATRSDPARSRREARRVAGPRRKRRHHRPSCHLNRGAHRRRRRRADLPGAADREGRTARPDEGAERASGPSASRRSSRPQSARQRGPEARPGSERERRPADRTVRWEPGMGDLPRDVGRTAGGRRAPPAGGGLPSREHPRRRRRRDPRRGHVLAARCRARRGRLVRGAGRAARSARSEGPHHTRRRRALHATWCARTNPAARRRPSASPSAPRRRGSRAAACTSSSWPAGATSPRRFTKRRTRAAPAARR